MKTSPRNCHPSKLNASFLLKCQQSPASRTPNILSTATTVNTALPPITGAVSSAELTPDTHRDDSCTYGYSYITPAFAGHRKNCKTFVFRFWHCQKQPITDLLHSYHFFAPMVVQARRIQPHPAELRPNYGQQTRKASATLEVACAGRPANRGTMVSCHRSM